MQILKRRSDAIYLTEMDAFIARRITYCGGFHPPAHHLFAGFFGTAVTGLRLVNSVKPSLLFSKLAVVLRGALVDLFRRPAGAADRNAFAVEAGPQLVKLRLLAFLLLG